MKRYKTFKRSRTGALDECYILNCFVNVKTIESNTIDFHLFSLLKD